jgi:hypothetical protein
MTESLVAAVSSVCGRLVVDRREQDGEKGGDRGRLPDVEVGIEVQLAVVRLREEIDARLTFRNGEVRAIELPEFFRKWLQLLGVMHQGLHLLFSAHRLKARQHARDGGRKSTG